MKKYQLELHLQGKLNWKDFLLEFTAISVKSSLKTHVISEKCWKTIKPKAKKDLNSWSLIILSKLTSQQNLNKTGAEKYW